MRVPLTVALVRDHRAAYAGVFASVLVASLVVSASSLLLVAAHAGDGMPTGVEGEVVLQDAQLTVGLVAATCVFGAVFLVSSNLGFVVAGRSRELGLLRLTGASGAQVGSLVLRESALVAGASALLGAAGSVVLLHPYLGILVHGGLAPAELTPTVRPGVALAGGGLVWAAGLLGAWAPAVRVGRVEPAVAVSVTSPARSVMSRTRWVVGGLGAAGAIVLLAIPAAGSTPGSLNAIMVGLAATSIVALTALAPVVVPHLAAALARLLSWSGPAPALLAGQRVRFDAARTASLANPAVLLVGIGGALFSVAQTGQAAGFAAWEPRVDAQAVVRDAPAASMSDYRAATGTAGVTRVARYDTAAVTADAGQTSVLVGWTDPTALRATAGLTVEAGGLPAVTGGSVAVRSGFGDLGESIALDGPDGRSVRATVVAVYESTTFVGADMLVDHDTFPLAGPATGTWFVTTDAAAAPAVVADLRQSLSTGTVSTTRDWIDAKIAAGRAGQTGLGPSLLGIALLTVVALSMSLLTSLRERRQEFARLETLGGSRPAIVGATLVETGIVLATAALLLVGVLGTIQLKAGQMLHAQQLAVRPTLPLGVLAGAFGLMAGIAALATVAGTTWATRNPQTPNAP